MAFICDPTTRAGLWRSFSSAEISSWSALGYASYSKTNPARIDVVCVENDLAKNRPFSHFFGATTIQFVMANSKKTEGTSAKGKRNKINAQVNWDVYLQRTGRSVPEASDVVCRWSPSWHRGGGGQPRPGSAAARRHSCRDCSGKGIPYGFRPRIEAQPGVELIRETDEALA